ncbi:MAG: aldo/keto reductase [Candidatus Spyradocola sp.]
MQDTKLGSTNIRLSRIVHGCMELGGGAWEVRPDGENISLLKTALEHGVTAFDTAESYGGGHSEEVVGAALAPVRDKVVLCTKVSKEHLHKADVIAACEGSLRRLKTDYIDLYYVHWPNPDIDIGETMEAFSLLKEQGKIRAIGVSNFSVAQMQAAERYAKLDALQPEYNLLCRGIEADVLPYCEENHISVLTYNSIAKGILSGVFHLGGAKVTDFRTAKPLFQEKALADELPLIELLRDIAQTHSVSLAQVAIAASLARPGVSATIVGTQNPAHFLDNIQAADLELLPDELQAIDETSARVLRTIEG